MLFRLNGREYVGETAAELVRAIEREAAGYERRGGPLRRFLIWSLARLGDDVPMRDLDLSTDLSDETLAYGYLCLLADYGLGEFALSEKRARRPCVQPRV